MATGKTTPLMLMTCLSPLKGIYIYICRYTSSYSSLFECCIRYCCHLKLLESLQEDIWIRGTALKWFEWFIINSTQKAKIGDDFSDIIELLFCVQQQSVLGPILLKIYIWSLHIYAIKTKFEVEGFPDHQLSKQFLITMQRKALGSDINNC